jgi:hypothetical protein
MVGSRIDGEMVVMEGSQVVRYEKLGHVDIH